MKTVAVFRSDAFNVSESRDYFLNPGCFGDDLARWMMDGLAALGIETSKEPGQEDFGWYFDFNTPDGTHCCVLAYRPGPGDKDGDWILWLERSAGLFGSLLGRRKRVSPVAVELVHRVLSAASEVTNLQWHDKRRFDGGDESESTSHPDIAEQ